MRRRQGQLHPWGFLLRQRDGELAAPPVALVRDHVALGRGSEPPPDAALAIAGAQQCPLQFISIDDDRVSRLHAALTVHRDSGRWPPLVTVEDHSRNGTYLNGAPLRPGSPAVLTGGDVLSLVLAVNPLTQLCFVFEECTVPPPNWPRAPVGAGANIGGPVPHSNTSNSTTPGSNAAQVRRPSVGGAPVPPSPPAVLPVGLGRGGANVDAVLSAAAVAAALAAGRGGPSSRNGRDHQHLHRNARRAGSGALAPTVSPTAMSTASTETLALDPMAAAAPHRLSATGFSEDGVEQAAALLYGGTASGGREVTSPQPSLPPPSLPQSPDRRRITRQSTGSGMPRSLSPDSSPTSGVGESSSGWGGGGRRRRQSVQGGGWRDWYDEDGRDISPTATPRSRVHNHTVREVMAALHPNPLYADHLTAHELPPGTAPPASPPRSPCSVPLRAPVSGAAARASRHSRRSTGGGIAMPGGGSQQRHRHRRSQTAHLGAHLLAFAAAGVAAPADAAPTAAALGGSFPMSRSVPHSLPDLISNHDLNERQHQRQQEAHHMSLQQHASAPADGGADTAGLSVPAAALSSVSDPTPASCGWPAAAGSSATSSASTIPNSQHHHHHQSLHSRYLLTGGAEAALNSPRRQRFSTGSGFGPPLPPLPPPAASAQEEPGPPGQRRARALSYGSGSYAVSQGGSGCAGSSTSSFVDVGQVHGTATLPSAAADVSATDGMPTSGLPVRMSAPALDAFGSISEAPLLTPAPPSAPLPSTLATASGCAVPCSPRAAPAAAAIIVGGGLGRSSRSSIQRPQSRLLRVSRPNSPLPGYEGGDGCGGEGGVGSTGAGAVRARCVSAGGASYVAGSSIAGGDAFGAVDHLTISDVEGRDDDNYEGLLTQSPGSPRFGPGGGRGSVGSSSSAASGEGGLYGATGGAVAAAVAAAGPRKEAVAVAAPLRRLCSAAVAALAAEGTASESDTPSEMTLKEFSFSASLAQPMLSAPAAAAAATGSPSGVHRTPGRSPSVPLLSLEPAFPAAGAASVNLEARLHAAAGAADGSGLGIFTGSPRSLRRTVSANDNPQAQTLMVTQQQRHGTSSSADAQAALGGLAATGMVAQLDAQRRSASAGSCAHGSSGSSGGGANSASSADCATASEASGGPRRSERLVDAAMAAVAAAAAQPYGGGSSSAAAAPAANTSSALLSSGQPQQRYSATGAGGRGGAGYSAESSGSGAGLSDASMPSPRWAPESGEDGGCSTPSSGRPQRLAAGRNPNRRLTRYGECLDTPSPRSPSANAGSSSSSAVAAATGAITASPFRHAASYRHAALAALAASASPARAPASAVAAVAAAASQAPPSPSPARAVRPHGIASPACRRLQLAPETEVTPRSPRSPAASVGPDWHHAACTTAEPPRSPRPPRPPAPSAATTECSVAATGTAASQQVSSTSQPLAGAATSTDIALPQPQPAQRRPSAARPGPSLPYTPSSLVRYLDSRLGSLAAAAEAAVAEAGAEIGAPLASGGAMAAATAAASGAAGLQAAAAPAGGAAAATDLPDVSPVPLPAAIGFGGGDGAAPGGRFNFAAPSFRGYLPANQERSAGSGENVDDDLVLTPQSGHGSCCGSSGGAAGSAAAVSEDAQSCVRAGGCSSGSPSISSPNSGGSYAHSCIAGNNGGGGVAARGVLSRTWDVNTGLGSPRAVRRALAPPASPPAPAQLAAASSHSGYPLDALDYSPPHKPIASTCATPRKSATPPHKAITPRQATTPRKHTPRAFSGRNSGGSGSSSLHPFHDEVQVQDRDTHNRHSQDYHHCHDRRRSQGAGQDCLLMHDQAHEQDVHGYGRPSSAATAAGSSSTSLCLPLQPSPSGRPATAASYSLPLYDAGSGSSYGDRSDGGSAQASARDHEGHATGGGWLGNHHPDPQSHYYFYPPASYTLHQQRDQQHHQERHDQGLQRHEPQVLQLPSRQASYGAASTLSLVSNNSSTLSGVLAPPSSEAPTTDRSCDSGGSSNRVHRMAGWEPHPRAQQQLQRPRVSDVSGGGSSSSGCSRPSTSGSGCSSESWAEAVVPVDGATADARRAALATAAPATAAAAAHQQQQRALPRPALSPLKVDVLRQNCAGSEGPATGRLAGSPGSTQLVCGLCAGGLRAAVALTPCGHSFCAECLAGHLGAAVLGGARLGCPNRCPAFEAVIINHPARRLQASKARATGNATSTTGLAPRDRGQAESHSSPFEAPAAAAAVAAHAGMRDREAASTTPLRRGERGASDPGPAASPALRYGTIGGPADGRRSRMGSRGSGYGPSPGRTEGSTGGAEEPGAWAEMLTDAVLPVAAGRLHLQQGEVLLRALRELLDDAPQLPSPPAAAASTPTTADNAAALREGRAAAVEWRRVVLDVLGCLGRLALEHPLVREALGAAGAAQGGVLVLRAVAAQMAAVEEHATTRGSAGQDKAAEAEADVSLQAEELATAQDTRRAACVLLCQLLNPPPPPAGGRDAAEAEQAVCRQQSNQWSLARMGAAEALLALLPAPDRPRNAGAGEGTATAGADGMDGAGAGAKEGGRSGAEERRRSAQVAAALMALHKMVTGNIMTQTHVAECGAASIVRALAAATAPPGAGAAPDGASDADEAVQTAALWLLADVARGGDAAHAAVRQLLLEEGALGAVLAALRGSAVSSVGSGGGNGGNDVADASASSGMSPVLTAALDALGVLLGPSQQQGRACEAPELLAVLRRELQRLGAPRLLRDLVQELKRQEADRRGHGNEEQDAGQRSASRGFAMRDGRVSGGEAVRRTREQGRARLRRDRCSEASPVLRAVGELEERVRVVAGGAGWVVSAMQVLGLGPDGQGQVEHGNGNGSGGTKAAAVQGRSLQVRLLLAAAGGGFALGAAVSGVMAAMWMA